MKSILIALLCVAGSLNSIAMDAVEREWTNKNGLSVSGKLHRIDGDHIEVMIRGKAFVMQLKDLSDVDREYVEQMRPKPPGGKISEYAAEFSDEDQRSYYQLKGLKSLAWNGDGPKEMLPFVLYAPKPRSGVRREFPIIIHLCGTGGIGKNNTHTIFMDAGGIAQTFFSDELQKKDPCYVMVPQPSHVGAWFSASYTDPSDTLTWVVTALRHLMEDRSYSIDPDRVYITGLSMGGAGVYQAMAKFPDVFAAGIPISYVETAEMFHEGNVGSMWVVLNSGDHGQPLSMFEDFKRDYKKLGGAIKSTVYEQGGHNAWQTMLGDQEFRIWLFRQKKGGAR